jgi:hypothetical protein
MSDRMDLSSLLQHFTDTRARLRGAALHTALSLLQHPTRVVRGHGHLPLPPDGRLPERRRMRLHQQRRGDLSVGLIFKRAGQLAATVTLALVTAGACESGNSAGGDAAAGASGQGGRAGGGAGGSTGSAGSTGAAGSETAGTTGTGGGNGGAANAGRGGVGGTAGSGGGAGGTTSACQAVLALDRSCTTAADCFAGAHTSNCCGQVQFIGFRNAVKTQFQTLEAECDLTYPPCGCAAGQPTADDGSRLRLTDLAGVTCLQGRCTTFLPDCGQPCGAGTTCFSCSNHAQMFAACTTMCADSNACTDPTLPLCQMGMSGNTSGKFCTASNVACDTK